MTDAPPERAAPDQSALEMAAVIVSAYVSNNSVPASELPALIEAVHSNLTKLTSGVPEAPVEASKEPAVLIKKSVTLDFIICLEDGKKFRSLKRHLAAAHGLTPHEYRNKWGLTANYPVVAPSYSSTRSELAKTLGLGAQKRERAEVKPAKKRANKKAASG